MSNTVLPGYTTFNAEAAVVGTRIKEPLGDGGHGQIVVSTIAELNAFLKNLPTEKIACHGLVLETDLRPITTRSVGYKLVGERTLAYRGTNGQLRIITECQPPPGAAVHFCGPPTDWWMVTRRGNPV